MNVSQNMELNQLIKERKISSKKAEVIKSADIIIIPNVNQKSVEGVNKGQIELFKLTKYNKINVEYLSEKPDQLKAYENYSEISEIGTLLLQNITAIIFIYEALKSRHLETLLKQIPFFKKLILDKKSGKYIQGSKKEIIIELEKIIKKAKDSK